MGPLGVRVDLRPGFVCHVGARSLKLGEAVLHLRLALRRKEEQKKRDAQRTQQKVIKL